MDFEYDLFLSYSTEPDYGLARHVEKFIESFHLQLPKDTRVRPLQVCRDGSDFYLPRTTGEQDTRTAISLMERELSKSRYLLVICSAKSLHSYFVNFEINWFVDHRPENILIAVSDGTDPSGKPEEILQPKLIELGFDKRIWYDFRGFYKKKAVAFRKVRNFEDECVQLAAHLNGESLGTLRPVYVAERERERKRRRLGIRLTLITITILLAVAGILAWRSNYLRQNAYNERMTGLARSAAILSLKASDRYDDDVAALLARQSYIYSERSSSPSIVEADNALRQVLGKPHFNHLLWWGRMQSDFAVFTPDAAHVAIEEPDQTVYWLDLSPPTLRSVKLSTDSLDIRGLDISPDGNLIAGQSFKDLLIWNMKENTMVRLPQQENVLGLILADSNHLFYNLDGRGLWMISGPDWKSKPVRILRSGINISALTKSRNGRWAYYRPDQKKVYVYDLHDLNGPVKVLSGIDGVYDLAFDDYHHRLYASCRQAGPDYWNLEEKVPAVHPVETGGVGSLHILAVSDSGYILTGSNSDDQVRIWKDITKEPEVFRTFHANLAAGFSPDGSKVTMISMIGDVRTWELAETGAVRTIELGTWSAGTPTVSADGSKVAVSAHSEVAVYDAQTRQVMYRSPPNVWESVCCLNSKGTLLAASGEMIDRVSEKDPTPVYLWDIPTHQRQPGHTLTAGGKPVKSICFSGDGTTLAAGDEGGEIRVWDMRRLAAPPILLNGHHGPVVCLALTKDGRRLFSGGSDGLVDIWDLQSRNALSETIRASKEKVTSIALTSDENTLAAAVGTAGVKLWDVTGSRSSVISNLNGELNFPATEIAFSSDAGSKWLAVGDKDEMKLINWKEPTAEPLRIQLPSVDNFTINGLVFTPGNDRIIMTSGTNTISMWMTSTSDLAELVCKKVNRSLTREQWYNFFGSNLPYEQTCGEAITPSP